MISNEQGNVGRYLKEIGEVPLLTPEEEKELAQKAQDGDQEALNKLVRSNLRFVVTVAKKYQNSGLPLEDLINEGNYGLIKAAKRFDVDRGFKFISYAVWWIRQAILQALAENGRTVRLPQNRIGTITKINGALEDLTQELGRQPTTEEIAEAIDVDEDKIEDAFDNQNRSSSVDKPFGGDEGEEGSLLDVMANEEAELPDEDAMGMAMTQEIELVLSQLSDREADIVRRYFGLNREREQTLEEIGDYYDISCERVRQLKARALKKMKRNGKESLL